MCQWRGVACGLRGSRHGRVVALDLSELNLLGTITFALGNLTYMRRLDLSSNRFHGVLPPELGNLRNLETLDLDYNFIQRQIPPSLSNCSHLVNISLMSNNLQGGIPNEFSSLHNLELLRLDQNKLTGRIHSSIGSLVNLKVLTLSNNNMVGQIPMEIGRLTNLLRLSLFSNQFSGTIPSSVGNLSALTVLAFYNNSLEGSIPQLQDLSSLYYLELGRNKLQGNIPSWLGNAHSCARSFKKKKNQFHGMLPSTLCNASMLQMIETPYNFLSGKIPQCLGTHQNSLSKVVFGINEFEATNDADWGFLVSLTNCSNLRTLDVGDNKLQGVLPNSIANLSTRLECLGIEYNNITGTITEGIGNLINLDTLYMGNNILTGSIPASLSKLKNLNNLYLSNNALSGPIPATLGNLTKLTTLILSTNAISGSIPASLDKCPLESADLSYNNLSGQIPKEIFLISTLSRFLNLADNSLSGILPLEVGNLKNLDWLDFSNNKISSEIPASIGECQSLEYLNTSGNLLQGTIPESLGNLRGLLVLDLSYNNLSGTIPEILGKLPGLSSLNLSFNKLQGNKLQGRVPNDGIFINATEVLIIGNDGLCGGIPQLQLTSCSNHSTKISEKLAIIVSTSSGFLFVTLVLFALSVFYRKNKKTKANLHRSVIGEQYMRVYYAELAHATNGFSYGNLIGAGSFGSVYKGTMRGNEQHAVVAVKVINLMQRGASQSFIAECETLTSVRHRNLVKILTVCSSIDSQGREFKALVYEFLPNGNLDQWLHQNIMEDGQHKALDLTARLCIAIDVASSLDYLHQHKPSPIIHCDLKPSNVLLDIDFVAHIGDFGLARFLHQDTEKSSGWASMRGSIGYAAPEYGQGNEVSTHGDVYSYGILLLEMFTGKRPTHNEFEEAIGLRKYVQMSLPDSAAIIIDQQLLTEEEDGEASTSNSSSFRETRIACIGSILQVGIRCSEDIPMDRPPIGDVLKELQVIGDKFRSH
ncbi:hypothetical protein BS78_K154300, partial [Paspalum vaginatum]